MKAILVEGDELIWGDAPEPTLGAGEVKIDNCATAVNRADLAQRAGGYPPPPGASPILGLECAGVVLEVGEGVTRVKSGDRVCALLAGGGHAETVVAPAGQVLPMPKGLSFAAAASLPEVFATAWINLFHEAAAQPGERVLLHAGACGVGTAAIQMCREFGNPCFVTAGSTSKIERCVELGADAGFNRHDGSFADSVRAWSAGGVDVILDPVGAAYVADNLKCLNLDGRLVIIGLLGGAVAEVPLGAMMVKRQRIIGSTLRARTVAAKAAVMDALQERVWPLIESGAITPIVEAILPAQQAAAAHELLATNDTFGKVVLEV
ncbi:MAG: NAD(P)H-quinone oxidoreductase [Gammaproteobacteria bacterium]|nr:NAD(P)H-quinone oxidoreductase [Gammaproteobacteria bacterium]